ncbi:MAG: cbb3-type cytochrome c oxidase subunit II [Planctomycetota bacterium]|nr:cbb3-type cytochrome c oxidase subunit II [Planctomycetota bacterium]
MKILERFGGVAGLAGVFCYFLAFLILIVGPAALTNANDPFVTDINGDQVEVPAYSDDEAAGREIYIQQVCWHCHSQFVRPVNEEDVRWGPVSQPGESVLDVPHLYSTRRIGPDLAREGWRRIDDWHIAHLWDPRTTVRDSVMPSFTWLFQERENADKIKGLLATLDSDGDGIISKKFDDTSMWPPEGSDLRKNIEALLSNKDHIDRRGVMQPTYKQVADGSDLKPDENGVRPYDAHAKWEFELRGDGIVTDYDCAPEETKEATQLVKYLQRLGIAIGKWRKPIVFGTPTRGYRPPMKGVTVSYKGWDEDAGAWADMEISVPDGEMPQRHADARRYGYLKDGYPGMDADKRQELDNGNKRAKGLQNAYDALMGAWRKANPDWDERLDRGKILYDQHCAACHGDEGRGNGMGAQFMLTRPRDLSKAKYRYRSTPVGSMPLDGDLFRSLYRGLPGSSMPPWRELPSEQLWLLVDYVKHFRESTGDDWNPGKPWDDVSKVTPMPALPKMTAEQWDETVVRGKAVYTAIGCNSCHGTEGYGDGPGWNDTGRDNGGMIRPRNFQPRDDRDITDLRFRGGIEPQDLYRVIFNGLDGVGMPAPALPQLIENGEKLEALKKGGASAAEIEAATKTAAKILNPPLWDEALVEAGHVVVSTDDSGRRVETVPQFRASKEGRGGRWKVGDEWAVVVYVMHLAGKTWEDWPAQRK